MKKKILTIFVALILITCSLTPCALAVDFNVIADEIIEEVIYDAEGLVLERIGRFIVGEDSVDYPNVPVIAERDGKSTLYLNVSLNKNMSIVQPRIEVYLDADLIATVKGGENLKGSIVLGNGTHQLNLVHVNYIVGTLRKDYEHHIWFDLSRDNSHLEFKVKDHDVLRKLEVYSYGNTDVQITE